LSHLRDIYVEPAAFIPLMNGLVHKIHLCDLCGPWQYTENPQSFTEF